MSGEWHPCICGARYRSRGVAMLCCSEQVRFEGRQSDIEDWSTAAFTKASQLVER